MALATYKDLCIDATDAWRLGRFWGEVLGLEPQPRDGGVVLRGPHRCDTIWVNAVPEPKRVKHRVHLDVRVAAVEPLVERGATVREPATETGRPWTVMADPEGGEFCAFVRVGRDAEPLASLYELVVDATDPEASRTLASWWADVLGGRCLDDGRGFWWVGELEGVPFETLDVIPVPEPKRVKNRIHWDVTCDDVPELVVRGASVDREPTPGTPWHVLRDPQGNEFCAFPSR